jgi:RecA/RadA recombinase
MGRTPKSKVTESVDKNLSDESSELLQSLLKESGNEYGADIVENGIASGDITHFISTGSYSLNALLSGSIYGGVPGNKIYALAGEPATGKSFYAINVVKQFLVDNPKGFVFYFETESAISSDMIKSRGIDAKRIAFLPVTTVQEFRTQWVKIVEKYLETPEKNRPRIMMVLDSLGNLSTTKEMEDIKEGKETKDMTRAQLIKAAFRVFTLKMGLGQIAGIVTNHTYDVVGSYVPMKKMGGGSGLEYCASGIVFLSKKKDKDKDNQVTGVILKATLKKSRLSIENKSVETLLDYRTGLDKYYGLTDLAIKFGIFKKMSTKIILPDGSSVFETEIDRNPNIYYTKPILDQIDACCKDEFLYGKTDYTTETQPQGENNGRE